MSIEYSECIFELMSLKLVLMIVYFLVMNNKRCITSELKIFLLHYEIQLIENNTT